VQNEEFNPNEYSAPVLYEKIDSPSEIIVPTPNDPPWNGWMALGVWLLSVLFILVFPLIFVLPYMLAQNVSLADKTQLAEFLTQDKTVILLQLLSVIPAHIFTLLVAWAVATNLRKYSFKQTLGWEWGGFKIWYAFVITAAFFVLAIGFKSIFPEQENEMDKILKSSQAAVFLVAFFATFTAPLVEEVVYRGILYSALQRRFGVILSVSFVTLLFAAVHIPQYSNNSVPDYGTITILILLSLVLTTVRMATDNLLPCIVLHTVFNGIQSALLIAQPYLEKYAKQTEEAPAVIIQLLRHF